MLRNARVENRISNPVEIPRRSSRRGFPDVYVDGRVNAAACRWLDDVLLALGDGPRARSDARAATTLDDLARARWPTARRVDDVVSGEVVVDLGAGHAPLAGVLYERGLLDASRISGYLAFDTSSSALRILRANWPREALGLLEIAPAAAGWRLGDAARLLDAEERGALLRGRPVGLVMSTSECRGYSPCNCIRRPRGEAPAKNLELFLAVERALAAHNGSLTAPRAAPHGLMEFGDAPPHVAKLVEMGLPGRRVFKLNAAEISPLNRPRSLSTTYAVPPVSRAAARAALSAQAALDAYEASHPGALYPDWSPGYRLFNAGRAARTPRSQLKPPSGFFERTAAATLAATHGGINICVVPSAGLAGEDCFQALGIMATSVLLGYPHCRFVHPGVSDKDAWAALGNSLQRAALQHIAEPWVAALERSAPADPPADPARADANANAVADDVRGPKASEAEVPRGEASGETDANAKTQAVFAPPVDGTLVGVRIEHLGWTDLPDGSAELHWFAGVVREVSDGTVAKTLKNGAVSKIKKWAEGFSRVEFEAQTARGEKEPTVKWVLLQPSQFHGDDLGCWRLDSDYT